MSDCPHCATLTEASIRKAFTERKPYRSRRLEMVEGWRDAVSPDGKRAVKAKFFCDACGRTTEVIVELEDERDPADWWKA